jgi:hypothetical protein
VNLKLLICCKQLSSVHIYSPIVLFRLVSKDTKVLKAVKVSLDSRVKKVIRVMRVMSVQMEIK